MHLSESFSEVVKKATTENFEQIKRKINVLDLLKFFYIYLKTPKGKKKVDV